MRTWISLIAGIVFATTTHAQSMTDAFAQGQTMGSTGNTAAHANITTGTAQTAVPYYTATPPETSYFGSASLGTNAVAVTGACTGASSTGYSDQACAAVNFSQTNPSRRPSFTIAPNDPLLVGAKTITADPQSIAGNIAGTYSACTVQTITPPAAVTTQVCHQYPNMQTATCEKTLTVQVNWSNSCLPGTWFGNFWVNTWGNGQVGVRYAGIAVNTYCQPGNTIRMRFNAICTESPCSGSADITVNATSGTVSPQTFTNFVGRSWYATDYFNRVDYDGGGCTADRCSFGFCTRYEDSSTSCDDSGTCTTTAINETRACGTFTFDRPRSIATVTDSWNNQCASFEARLP